MFYFKYYECFSPQVPRKGMQSCLVKISTSHWFLVLSFFQHDEMVGVIASRVRDFLGKPGSLWNARGESNASEQRAKFRAISPVTTPFERRGLMRLQGEKLRVISYIKRDIYITKRVCANQSRQLKLRMKRRSIERSFSFNSRRKYARNLVFRLVFPFDCFNIYFSLYWFFIHTRQFIFCFQFLNHDTRTVTVE